MKVTKNTRAITTVLIVLALSVSSLRLAPVSIASENPPSDGHAVPVRAPAPASDSAETVAPASAQVPDLLALGQVRPVGKARFFSVRASRPIRIRVEGVGTISGPRNAVTGTGVIRVRKFRGQLRGVQPAGLGLDVAMRGIKLRKRLKLTHTVAPKPGGSVPAFAHRLPNGTWELKPATFDRQGRMIIRTRTFSINLPSFLDPQTYTSAIGNFVAQKVGGRTSPVECPAPSPQWFTVSNLTVTAHACGQNNPATDGAERAELRIKNNRGAVQQVTLAGPRDFVYVEGQPDALRAAIGRITGTDPSNTVFLSPGDGGYMTVGYRRPASQGTYSTIVETTYQSLFLNYAYMAVSTFADIVGDDVKLVAAIRLAQECLGTYDLTHGTVKDPKTAISSTSFVEVFGCVLGNAAEELADPKKALAAAINLTEGHLPGYTTDQLTEQLTKVGGRLMDLGRIVRLFNILPVLQQNVQGAIDTFFALTSGGTSTHVDVDLASAATPPVDTPPDTARSIVVDNRVTNGASAMREDTPAYLSTRTTNFCKRDGCALPGTDFGSGTNLRAECTVIGNRTTNGQDNSAIDDANPGLYTSTRWYGIRWGDGRFGFLSEVWVAAAFRGGLNLPAC